MAVLSLIIINYVYTHITFGFRSIISKISVNGNRVKVSFQQKHKQPPSLKTTEVTISVILQ